MSAETPDVMTYEVQGDIAVVTFDNPPVNALSAAVRQGLVKGIEDAASDPAVKAVVLICAGRTFFAGADITEFGKPPVMPLLPEVVDRIEASEKPVISAIHGTALGGGMEVALGSRFRVAVPSAKLGLPEVKLGLLPGAGGTQRLPRAIGPELALGAIVSGDPFPAKMAAMGGLVDELVEEGKLKEGALAFARKVIDENRPIRRLSQIDDKVTPYRGRTDWLDTFRQTNARKLKGLEAPEAIFQAVQAAIDLPYAEGAKVEREQFMKLLGGQQSAALRHVFFAERMTGKVPDIADDTPLIPVEKVGVIGAGTMGGGISMNFLNAGIPVTIVEMKQEALDRGVATIRKNYENTAKKGRITAEDVEKRMALLTPSLNLEDLADRDLIIEAVFENMDIKKDVFGKLDRIAKPGAILASNTSYLNVDEIAASTSRPESVLGLHFFSPANVMKLLEVVRAEKTSKPVIATAMALARKIGKVPVLAGVCFGFIGNRMLFQRQNQANALLLEGAMPWDVDRVHQEFGMPMGPFQMADLAGLDIGWSAETSKGETVRDRLCEQDKRGQKTGSGFYDYDEKRNATPSKTAEGIILDIAREHGIERRQISDQEILERTIYPMINEGAKILEEGKASRPSDIDIVWIYGYGWPPYRGGPMFHADQVGLPQVMAALEKYRDKDSEAFTPSLLLKRLADEGKGFKDL
ncbi:MAG: 3-hydroxyacyl-CoA dehydrogenase NAD-binding domain-containing protein [Caulobacteraceae bacterium]